MLTSIHIKDFQAHASLTVPLDPRITTIVGASDRGKSAVLRALRWLCLNKPGGEAFIKDGTTGTIVTVNVLTDYGYELPVQRERGKVNVYRREGTDYKAFGADVPPDIASLLNVSAINFQQQHDPPFWFGDTPGEVSRQLNEIVNLGDMDRVLGKLAAGVREAAARLELCEQRRAAAKLERDRHEIAGEMNDSLGEVEALEAIHKDKALAASQLRLLVEEVRKQGVREGEAQRRAQAGCWVLEKGDAWAALHGKRADLEKQLGSIRTLSATASRTIPPLAPVEALGERLAALEGKRRGLAEAMAAVRRLTSAVRLAEADASMAEVVFETEMGERCPLCGSPNPTK